MLVAHIEILSKQVWLKNKIVCPVIKLMNSDYLLIINVLRLEFDLHIYKKLFITAA